MNNPKLSIIVIGYKMPRQLEQTLYTLSCQHQLGVSEDDYEIIVVENESDQMLTTESVSKLGNNFHYFPRQETSHSPVPAVNFGFKQCRGELIGLLIDGAHMVTPRVVQYALMAHRALEHAVIVTPGYHLGGSAQENNEDNHYNEVIEQQLLAELDWKENGYRLFDIAAFSPANKLSYMHPIMECNCLFASRLNFERIGYCDERFSLKGGGSVNLHMYRRLGTLPEAEIVVLAGEGSFHQYHGGVSTSQYADRTREITLHREQLESYWGAEFQAVRKEPIIIGAITNWAHKFLQQSSEYAQRRHNRLSKLDREEWEDKENPKPSLPSLSIPQARQQIKDNTL